MGKLWKRSVIINSREISGKYELTGFNRSMLGDKLVHDNLPGIQELKRK